MGCLVFRWKMCLMKLLEEFWDLWKLSSFQALCGTTFMSSLFPGPVVPAAGHLWNSMWWERGSALQEYQTLCFGHPCWRQHIGIVSTDWQHLSVAPTHQLSEPDSSRSCCIWRSTGLIEEAQVHLSPKARKWSMDPLFHLSLKQCSVLSPSASNQSMGWISFILWSQCPSVLFRPYVIGSQMGPQELIGAQKARILAMRHLPLYCLYSEDAAIKQIKKV